MSEFSVSSTATKKTHFSSLLLSDFFLFCSFIFSHPLYFFYFIFFSPYLLKLLSFLSPLFITTSLLLLALLTFSPNLLIDISHTELSDSKVSFMLGTYEALVERWKSKVEDGNEKFFEFEELEAYKIVFDTSNLEIGEAPVDILEEEAKENRLAAAEVQVHKRSSFEGSVLAEVSQVLNGNLVESSVVITRPESAQLIAEEKRLGGFLHQKEEFEDLPCQKDVKEVKPLSVNTNKVEEQKEEPSMRNGSKATGHKVSAAEVSADDGGEYYNSKQNSQRQEENFWSPDHDGNYNSKVIDNSQTSGSNLGSFGSMRKEKEWRRTLACKLFEERHNADGGEGMDLLWETYETDSVEVHAKSKSKKGKRGSIEYHDEEEDEGEEEGDGQLCCLQALKFSAGKMNLGMGRPSLVKISKALKGIGWLHHVGRSGKKGYH